MREPATPPRPDPSAPRPQPDVPSAARTHARAIAVGAVLLIALLLRLWEWTSRGLWFDEAFTWRLVEFPLAEMMDRAARDNSPPLYYLLLHAWVRAFGDSLAALRGLSALCGVLAVAGMYLFAREALEARGTRARGLALFVAALTATSAFQVRYSGEVRPYALGAALAALSAWTLSRATRPGLPSARAWAAYGVVTLLFAYTHYYALFSVAAQAAYLAGWLLAAAGWRPGAALRDPRLRYALLAGAIVAAGWLPWLPTFLKQRAQVQAAFWATPVGVWTVPELCYEMFADPLPPLSWEPSQRRLAVTAALCAAGLVALGRRARGAEWHVLLAAVGPFALSVAASEQGTQTLTLRYFLFAHLFLLAGVGILVWRIRRGVVRRAVAVAVLAVCLAGSLGFLHGLHLDSCPGARGAAEFIAAHRRPGEPVVAASPLWYQPVAYHLGGRGVLLFHPDGPMPHYYGTAVLSPGEVLDGRSLTGLGGSRLWAVGGVGRYWGCQEVPAPDGWRLVETRSFPEALRVGKVVVRVYERQDAPWRPAADGGAGEPCVGRPPGDR
jgi:hypothetical protein